MFIVKQWHEVTLLEMIHFSEFSLLRAPFHHYRNVRQSQNHEKPIEISIQDATFHWPTMIFMDSIISFTTYKYFDHQTIFPNDKWMDSIISFTTYKYFDHQTIFPNDKWMDSIISFTTYKYFDHQTIFPNDKWMDSIISFTTYKYFDHQTIFPNDKWMDSYYILHNI